MHARHTRSDLFLITLTMPLACALRGVHDGWKYTEGAASRVISINYVQRWTWWELQRSPAKFSPASPLSFFPVLPPTKNTQSRIPSCHCCAPVMRHHCAADSAALSTVYLSPRLFMHGFICLLIWIHREIKHMRAFFPGSSLFSHGTHPYIISLSVSQAKCSDAVWNTKHDKG